MKISLARLGALPVLAFVLAASATAAEPQDPITRNEVSTGNSLSELSLENFFSAGWGEPWVKRPHPDGAPDLTLLRVQSNLLLTSLRTDFYHDELPHAAKDRRVNYVSELVEYSLNRRVMLAAFGNYQWIESRSGTDREGGSFGTLVRLQLVDLPRASYALNFRAAAPNEGLGEKQTPASVALAGWHDLTQLGFGRVGVYWHAQEETLFGPRAAGTRQNDATYDVSLARTWSGPAAALENFSTFVEAFAKTDIDGRHHGDTAVSLTPGFRFNVHHRHVFMFGVDIPVTEPRANEERFRFTYILSF
jgi:hypothetical protein